MFLDEEVKCILNNKIENKFKEHIFDSKDKNIDYSTFSKIVMSLAREFASKKKQDFSGWYSFSKNLIDLLMVNRAKLLDLVKETTRLHQAKIMCKDAKSNLKNDISIAKSNWTSHLAERIHEMSRNSTYSLKAVNTLKKLIQGHHKTPDIMRFIKEDGNFTGTDEEKSLQQ